MLETTAGVLDTLPHQLQSLKISQLYLQPMSAQLQALLQQPLLQARVASSPSSMQDHQQ
jgi:hypothetical protein